MPLACSRGVSVREYRMARFNAVLVAVFAVILACWGVTGNISGVMGWTLAVSQVLARQPSPKDC